MTPAPQSPEVVRSSLRHMHSVLGLRFVESPPEGCRVSPRNAVIVSIDFENPDGLIANGEDVNTQMGVAILDPLDLHKKKSQTPPDDSQLIRTFHFASGTPEYIGRTERKFLHGETIKCSPCDFIASLTSLWPQDRPFILVAHGLSRDRAVLDHLGYKFDDQPRLSGIVDTYPMAGDVFRKQRGYGPLRKLLTDLEVQWGKDDFHCAGNDARYTLQAALLLSERGYLQQCLSPGPEDSELLATIRRVATAHVSRERRRPLQSIRQGKVARQAEVAQMRALSKAKQAMREAEVEEQGFAGLSEGFWPAQI